MPKLEKKGNGRGWHNESYRHSLAARGISTIEKPNSRPQFRPLTPEERKKMIQELVHREMFTRSPYHKKTKRKLIKRLKRESIHDKELQHELDYSLNEKYGTHPFGKWKLYRHRSGDLYIIDIDDDLSLATVDQREALNFILEGIEWWTEATPTILIRRE